MIVSSNQIEKSCQRYENWEKEKAQKGKQPKIFEFEKEAIPEITHDNIMGNEDNRIKRKKNIQTNAVEPTEFAYERAIGKNDSVYSNFVDLLYHAKKKVGRVVIKDGLDTVGYATGFMVSKNLMLTNWHVFRNKEEVQNSQIEFHHEYDTSGNPSPTVRFNLDINKFFYSFEEYDYCLVAVKDFDITEQFAISDIGFIYLDPVSGKLGDLDEEALNIVHHPNGDFKQLSIRENKFVAVTPITIWYQSDTAQGSSGSPVFNDQWQLVGLHHSGVPRKNANGDYLDKDGQIIPVVDGRIDISKVDWKANEGIRISVIRRHLQKEFPNNVLIAELLNPTSSSNSSPDRAPVQPDNRNFEGTVSSEDIQISIPSSLLQSEEKININLTTNRAYFPATRTSGSLDGGSVISSSELESLRLERSMDYTKCDGYESDFLGDDNRISIPKPTGSAWGMKARLTGSRAYILRYYKFSVIQNALRKMPFISAINIDGDEAKRQDFTERRDKWIRDNRMDLEVQLDNKFYVKSGFDRGHMSRREDANWGESPAEALRNANLTCVHTNACPQVPKLNRSTSRGLWGKLEKIVLEQGAEEETGKLGKISVFSGPIFRESDPVYKGIQVPMDYYKIILWLSDEEELKATAFKLSQSQLVDDIDFDLEDLDIQNNMVFKEFQCSITALQAETSLDFSKLIPLDTFAGAETELELTTEEQLMEVFGSSGRRAN